MSSSKPEWPLPRLGYWDRKLKPRYQFRTFLRYRLGTQQAASPVSQPLDVLLFVGEFIFRRRGSISTKFAQETHRDTRRSESRAQFPKVRQNREEQPFRALFSVHYQVVANRLVSIHLKVRAGVSIDAYALLLILQDR